MSELDFKFNEVVNKYSEMLYNIAIGYLKNKDDADDILQEVFIKYICYINRKNFKDDNHEKFWLIRVTINLCNNELKSAKRKNISLVEIDEIENFEIESSQDEKIVDIINCLEIKYRDVFRLFYVEGFKITEISKILGISENNVKTRLKRARDKIRKILKIGGEK